MMSTNGTPILKHVAMLSQDNSDAVVPISPTPLRRSTTADNSKSKQILKMNSIIGTTAVDSLGLTVSDDMIAYNVGAGAVVANIESDRIVRPRFFCTSSRHLQLLQGNLRNASAGIEPYRYDEYGYIIPLSATGQGTAVLDNAGDSSSPLNSGSLSEDLSSLSLSPARGPSNKSGAINIKDKMKTATSVALSASNSVLAVGETGHQPRIFIYSLAGDSNGLPIAVIAEHRFGVKALAFSPCGKFLASLGTMEDGFIHIWSLGGLQEGNISLHSSNRCITAINDMRFINDDVVMTVGVRNMRLWKVDRDYISRHGEHKVATLSGKSVILGECNLMNFTSIEVVYNSLCLVGTEQGVLLRLEYDHVSESSSIAVCAEPDFNESKNEPIAALAFDRLNSIVWVYQGNLVSVRLQKVLETRRLRDVERISDVQQRQQQQQSQQQNRRKRRKTTGLVTALFMRSPHEFLILDNTCALRYSLYDGTSNEKDADLPLIDNVGKKINGLKALTGPERSDSQFVTWSSEGLIKEWDYTRPFCLETHELPTSKEIPTEWTTFCQSEDGKTIFAGNTLGQVLVKRDSATKLFNVHIGGVTDMDYFRSINKKYELLVTGSRDRTIQVFIKREKEVDWNVLQTITDSHKANVLRVRFTKSGNKVVSCSADRSVFVHSAIFKDEEKQEDLIGFISTKILSLKTSPSDMLLNEKDEVILAISKTIQVYGIIKGDLIMEYRVFSESENAQLTSIAYSQGYLAISGSDKCLKLYENSSGDLRSTHWGHSSSVAGMAWISRSDNSISLVTCTQDGCMFLWDLVKDNSSSARDIADENTLFSNEAPAVRSGTPTRKVIRKDELSRFIGERSSISPVSSSATAALSGMKQSSPSSSPTRGRMSVAPLARNELGSATKSVSPTRAYMRDETSITDICKGLRKIQENYTSGNRQPITSSLSLELRTELRKTLELLEGSDKAGMRVSNRSPVRTPSRSPTRVSMRSAMPAMPAMPSNGSSGIDTDEKYQGLVEKFGEQLVALVEKKLSLPRQEN